MHALLLLLLGAILSCCAYATKAGPSSSVRGARLYHPYENAKQFGSSEPVRLGYTVAETPPSLSAKAPVVCIHGFGGNADQWRKNLPALAAEGHKTYAVDLLGYGYSDKPDPRLRAPNSIYNFENWAEQTVDFVKNVVREPVFLVSNSVGGCVALQAAVTNPDLVKGVVLIDISLRMLHVKKQSPPIRPIVKLIQTTLRETPLGELFFKQVAEKRALKNVLTQAYAGDVDDETVDFILKPGLETGAAAVFLDFISYSGGPLPEELLAKCSVPVRVLWGENDPWEPIEMGRELMRGVKCVDEFVTLQRGGHCPMDQIPETVNAELLRFLKK